MRALLLCLAVLTAPVSTQVVAAPAAKTASAADQLVNRYIAWRGGAAFERLRSIHSVADVEYDGLKGVIRDWRDRSGRARNDFKTDVFSQLTVHNGKVGWVKDNGLVSQIGRLEDQDARRTNLLEFADALHGGLGSRAQRLPDETIDGRDVSVLRLTFGDTDFYDLLIDPATGALHSERIRTDGRTRFTRLGDWRMVDGIRMPFLIEQYRANGKINATLRVRSISLNVKLAQSLFRKPETERTLAFAAGAHATGPIKYNPYTGTRIFIPAEVNGRKVEVLLDSGADTTVIDKSFAETIGRKMVGSGTATGTGGEQDAGYAKDIAIRIGNMSLTLPTVGVIDFTEVSKRLELPLPVVLGKDVFLQSVIDIDPSATTIAFHDTSTFTPPPGATLVPLEPLGSLRVVPASVEGLPEAPMIFDLGNGGYMSLTPAYWQKHHLLDRRRSSTRSAGAVGGEQINRMATLKTVRFAGITFKDVPAEFVAPNVEIDSDREAGNIGMPLLGRFRMFIDFGNNRMFVVPLADKIDAPFSRDRVGLRAVRDANRLTVTYVSEHSPAEAAGWKTGDVIVAIDGTKIGPDYATGALARWNVRPPGTIVTFTMADGSTRKLTLADYF